MRLSYWGGFSCCGAWTLWRAGFSWCWRSCCRARILGRVGFSGCGAQAPWHLGSSQTKGGTCVYCIGRWIFYHWATKEVLIFLLSHFYFSYWPAGVLKYVLDKNTLSDMSIANFFFNSVDLIFTLLMVSLDEQSWFINIASLSVGIIFCFVYSQVMRTSFYVFFQILCCFTFHI